MKKLLFVSLFIVLNVALLAQTKILTLKDAVYNQYFSLAPKKLNQIQFVPNTNTFCCVEDWNSLIFKDIQNKEIKRLSIDDVNKSMDKNIEYFYDLKWIDENSYFQIAENIVYQYNVKSKKVENLFELPENSSNIFYNTDAKAVAFTIENNLQLMLGNGQIVKISDESNKGIVYGSDYVHRQEFGIDKGIFWSPKGKKIAFYRKDETMVTDYPIVDFTKIPAVVNNIKYPMAGQTSEQVTLGVFDLGTKQIVYIKTGEPKDQFLTSITWDPSEKFIYIGVLNREQNHLKFNKYDATTGDFVKTLFEEKNDKYVEPQHPAIFLTKTTNHFLWYSQRDGYNHLYLYDTDGKLIKQVTKGNWIVTNFYGFSPDEKYIYFQSTAVCPIQRHPFKVELNSGKMTQLANEEGMHESKFSSDMNYMIDWFSSKDVPYIANLIDNKGKILKNLMKSENPLSEYKLGKVKFGILKAADGKTDLYYNMVLPTDFDSTKKYPVIVYVYGGPHAQLVQDEWVNGGLWNYYMAQKGYIVFTIDNRGSADRGFEFESIVHRQLGVEEMKDQMEGVKFLKSLKYVDSERMGVHGWSFGGFMTISLLTTYPDVFKVGVAGGPVIDWKLYEVMYGERYMDTPQENAENYDKTSILNKIDKLKAKLLVIHGFVDPVVVPQNTQLLLIEAQKKGKQIDFYDYPTSEHNVRGMLRIHLMEKITNYFDDYLK